MGKFTETQVRIFSIFNSDTWKAEAIKTIPQDVSASNLGDEFIRVSIIPSQRGINRISTMGVCIIDIFVAAGKGPSRYHAIADKLDDYLQDKQVKILLSNNVVQFGASTLVPIGLDKDNPNLTRAQYTIPFNLFGVLQ